LIVVIGQVRAAAAHGCGREECPIERSVVGDVMESFYPSAKAKGLKMAFHMDAGNVSFPTDMGKLHQILSNLLANGVRFSDSLGKVEIWVAEREGRLTVKVVDQGPGIPEKELRTLFEPFHPMEGPCMDQRGQGLGRAEEWQGRRQAAQDRYSGGSWRFLSRFKTRKLEKSNRRFFDFAVLRSG